jgi:hypothetical protein
MITIVDQIFRQSRKQCCNTANNTIDSMLIGTFDDWKAAFICKQVQDNAMIVKRAFRCWLKFA